MTKTLTTLLALAALTVAGCAPTKQYVSEVPTTPEPIVEQAESVVDTRSDYDKLVGYTLNKLNKIVTMVNGANARYKQSSAAAEDLAQCEADYDAAGRPFENLGSTAPNIKAAGEFLMTGRNVIPDYDEPATETTDPCDYLAAQILSCDEHAQVLAGVPTFESTIETFRTNVGQLDPAVLRDRDVAKGFRDAYSAVDDLEVTVIWDAPTCE